MDTRKLPRKVSRRAFLGTTGKLILGTAGVLLADGALFYYGASAKANKQKSQEGSTSIPGNIIKLGTKDQFDAIQDVKQIDYTAMIEDGWVKQNRQGFVFAVRDDNNELIILSPTCTHLGCTVPLASDEERKTNKNVFFKCPCHGGEYDRLGRNIGGPPPRPLDEYKPVEIGGELYIDIFSPVQRKR